MKSSGARVDKGKFDALRSRLALNASGLPIAVEDAMNIAAEYGTQAMEDRIRTAVTDWGRTQVGRGVRNTPGRIDSGDLISSLRTADGAATRSSSTDSGMIALNFGYKKDIGYTRAQENVAYSISGQLLARQRGFNVFVAKVFDEIAEAYELLDDGAKRGQQYRRRAASFRTGQSSRMMRS